MMRITDDLLRPTGNNLTLARLLLASLVIYTHSFEHFTHIDTDNFAFLLGSPLSHHAVDGFFFLAGFLVYRSIIQNPSLPRFLLARVTRLLPALALMILIVVTVGAFVTRVPVISYLTGAETLKFIVFNLSLSFPAYHLTGIRCGDELCLINGSLWTLPWEARCYLVLVMLAFLNLTRRSVIVQLILPIMFGAAVGWAILRGTVQLDAMMSPGIFYYLNTAMRFAPAFLLGIVAYEMRAKIVLSWGLLAAIFAINVAIQWYVPMFGQLSRLVFIAYVVLCLGFLTSRRGSISANWPDYSYGIYIYGFPVMIAAAALFPISDPLVLAATTLCLTIPFAAGSWHWVEKPALDWLRRRQRTAFTARKGAPAAGG